MRLGISNAGWAWRGLFALVILTGSFLLFLVQPMVARFALPLLGGAPAVWNSAMLVFQILLLGGYAYAHGLARLSFRRQAALHIGLLAAVGLTLPITLADIPSPTPGWEALWVPALFIATIGPVFLLLSAQASLMQRWFAGIPEAKNPYALYAASNLGSFGGLLAYPFWLEPRMALAEQSRVWASGYALLVVLVVVAAASRWNVVEQARPPVRDTLVERIGGRRIALWLALAAVPSGLMLSTTTLLTTDLMAMPLLWVIPLGAYLLSFSVAFSAQGEWARILSGYAPVLLLVVGGLAMISGGQANPATALAMVALLFVLSVALHGRLYETRPGPEQLTLFYLVLAAGGALGGLFTALVAPVVFDWIYEHALLLLAAALLLPRRPLLPLLARLWPAGLRHSALLPMALLAAAGLAWWLMVAVEQGKGSQILLLTVAMALIGLLVSGRRWALAAVLGLLMLGHGGLLTLQLSLDGARSRSYFGVYSVEEALDGRMLRLNHGTTMHGQQWLEPGRRQDPTSYYGPRSGVGGALASVEADAAIGVVGLGVGTLACYRQPRQQWTFFEIDPKVVDYSRDGTFTYLADCTPDARTLIGDARLELARLAAGTFDLLAVDAFTSDAIPLHLMTEEAFATYRRVMAPDGLLLIHISNRFFNLAPMVSALAEAGGWQGRVRRNLDEPEEGLSASVWIVLAEHEERLVAMEQASGQPWEPLPSPARQAWTDDNASVLPLIRF